MMGPHYRPLRVCCTFEAQGGGGWLVVLGEGHTALLARDHVIVAKQGLSVCLFDIWSPS